MLFSSIIDTLSWIEFSTGYQPYRSLKQILDMSLLMIGWRPSGACVGDLSPRKRSPTMSSTPRGRSFHAVVALPLPAACRSSSSRFLSFRSRAVALAQRRSTIRSSTRQAPRLAATRPPPCWGLHHGGLGRKDPVLSRSNRPDTGQPARVHRPVRIASPPAPGPPGVHSEEGTRRQRRSRGDGEGLGVPPVPGKHRDRASPTFH